MSGPASIPVKYIEIPARKRTRSIALYRIKQDEATGGVIFCACAYCPQVSVKQVEIHALELGYTVSHGICPECFSRIGQSEIDRRHEVA